jgi:hypothetical protein
MTEYVIFSKIENLFWSNELGWTGYFSATTFTEGEKECFNLPIGGVWRKVYHLGTYSD